MLIYLDNCCFNRPFDDQNQIRIRIETEAKLFIQENIITKRFRLAWSYILTRWCGFVIRTSAVKAENKTVVSEELLKEYCLQQWHRLPQSDPLGTNLRQRGQSRL